MNMSLTAAIIVFVVLAALLIGLLVLTMTRPKELRPHRSRRRLVRWRRQRPPRPQ
jgi:hypothetical protein